MGHGEQFAHLDARFFKMMDKFFDLDVGINFFRKAFISLTKSTFRGFAAVNRAIDVIPQSGPFHPLRRRWFRWTPTRVFTCNGDDWRMTPIRVLHIIAKFVTNSFDPQGPPTSDSNMKNKVIPIRGRGQGIFNRGENRGTGVETWHDGQHIVVCDGYFECCYVDLAEGCGRMGDGDG